MPPLARDPGDSSAPSRATCGARSERASTFGATIHGCDWFQRDGWSEQPTLGVERNKMVTKLITLADYIIDAERVYDKVSEESGFRADYALGRLRGLQDAERCSRLTSAEKAVLDAILCDDFKPSYWLEKLAYAVADLRRERAGK